MIHLVVGPPCGGKSTYVREHAEPSDIVIDYDDIAREMGSPSAWQHDAWFGRLAAEETERRIAALQSDDDAWVIRCAADLHERADLATALNAEVIVCDPGENACLFRAQRRPSGTRKAIRMWYWRNRRLA